MQAWARAEGVIEDVNERLEMKIKRLRDEARERQASYERSSAMRGSNGPSGRSAGKGEVMNEKECEECEE
jgi:hypothetical protein